MEYVWVTEGDWRDQGRLDILLEFSVVQWLECWTADQEVTIDNSKQWQTAKAKVSPSHAETGSPLGLRHGFHTDIFGGY